MLRARIQILAAAVLFSTGGTVIKLTALSGMTVAGLRSVVAAVVLMLAVPAWRRFWGRSSLAVGAAYAATLILFVSANKLTTAANAIFLQSTAPIYVLLLAPRLLGERPGRADLAHAAGLFVGLTLFFVGREPELTTAPNPALGNWIALASGVAWALTLLGIRWLSLDRGGDDAVDQPEERAEARSRTGRAVVAGNWIAFALCLPFIDASAVSLRDAGAVIYLGAFQIGLAYFWLTRGSLRVSAFEISLLLLVEPVFGAVWAGWILAEVPGTWSLAGCAVIVATTVLRALSGYDASRRSRSSVHE